MNASTARPLLSPEEIAVRAGEQAPFLRFAERATVFGEREMRLRQLAAGHAMRDYLLFVAEIARVQGELLQAPIEARLPSATDAERAARDGVALLPAVGAPRDAAWLVVQRRLLARLAERLPAGPALEAVRGLAAASDADIDAQADRLLAGVMLGLDLAAAPLVAAGLQVWFSHLVLATEAAFEGARTPPFGRVDEQTRCPCCASLPTSGIVRIGAAEAGFRYLACSLCSTQWHMVRIKCSHCLSTKGIGYQSLSSVDEDDATGGRPGRAVEGNSAAVRAVQAECCSECGHYLKMLHMERDPNVDPIADDLASITLDLLVSEGGLARHGVNLMLLFGDPEAGTNDPGGG